LLDILAQMCYIYRKFKIDSYLLNNFKYFLIVFQLIKYKGINNGIKR
jgi:hypothetical protein